MSRRAGSRAQTHFITPRLNPPIVSSFAPSVIPEQVTSTLFDEEKPRFNEEENSEDKYLSEFIEKRTSRRNSGGKKEKEEDLLDLINDNSDGDFRHRKPSIDLGKGQFDPRRSDTRSGFEPPMRAGGGTGYPGLQSQSSLRNSMDFSSTQGFNQAHQSKTMNYLGQNHLTNFQGLNGSNHTIEEERFSRQDSVFTQGNMGDDFQNNYQDFNGSNDPTKPRSRRERGKTTIVPSKIVIQEPDFTGNASGGNTAQSSPGVKLLKPPPNGNFEQYSTPDLNNSTGGNQQVDLSSPIILGVPPRPSSVNVNGNKTHTTDNQQIEREMAQNRMIQTNNLAIAEKLEKMLAGSEKEEKFKAEKERLESELKNAQKMKEDLEEFMKREMARKDEELTRTKQTLEEENAKNVESIKKMHQEELKTQRNMGEMEKKRLEEMLKGEREALKKESETKWKLAGEIEKLSLQMSEMNQRAEVELRIGHLEKNKHEENQQETAKMALEKVEMESGKLAREKSRFERISDELSRKEAELKEEIAIERNELRKERERLIKDIEEMRNDEMKRKGEFFKEKAAVELAKAKYEKESMSLKEEYERKKGEIEAKNAMLESMERGIKELQSQTDLEISNLKGELEKRRRIIEENERSSFKMLRDVELIKGDLARKAETLSAKERMALIREKEAERKEKEIREERHRIEKDLEEIRKFKTEFKRELERIENERLQLEIERRNIGSERHQLETQKQSVEGTQKTLMTLRREYIKGIGHSSTFDAGNEEMTGRTKGGECFMSPVKSQTQFKPLIRAQTSAGPVSLIGTKGIGTPSTNYFSSFARDYENQLKQFNHAIKASHHYNESEKIKRGNFF